MYSLLKRDSFQSNTQSKVDSLTFPLRTLFETPTSWTSDCPKFLWWILCMNLTSTCGSFAREENTWDSRNTKILLARWQTLKSTGQQRSHDINVTVTTLRHSDQFWYSWSSPWSCDQGKKGKVKLKLLTQFIVEISSHFNNLLLWLIMDNWVKLL